MESKNGRLSWFVNRTPLFYCTISIVVLLFFSASAILSTTTETTPRHVDAVFSLNTVLAFVCLADRIQCQMITSAEADTYMKQESENVFQKIFQKIFGNNEVIMSKSSPESEVSRTSMVDRRTRRRLLGGPGSWPPRCMSKCGRCSPCKPIHVPVPPGTPVTTEYYPEAWRCKCGNRLFMP
ncbi:hypothetical protein RHSIM_Rhsim13G0061100 [Rhododendron simsii]|uniref:Epidermal patterning factor-like protein n=1 Tax=Rhododendron simsii TaxID=118357 RepID=A0A834FZC6_RHOSS|nr:hypothetical protein RHSIM_Rhsim13G0061100 [Rhododendron simsii]